MTKEKFFILGRPRSGTTLLRALFDAHPNVRIAPEFPMFLPLYQKYRKVEPWNRETVESFVEDLFRPVAFGNRRIDNLRIDRQAFVHDLERLAAEGGTIQDMLFSINEHAWSPFPKNEILLVGDKNPVYSIHLRRLSAIFPDAKFICLVRDYRDTFCSLKNLEGVFMEAPDLTLQVLRWRHITRRFLDYCGKNPGRFRLVKYEDLVTDPEFTMSELCQFLRIPYDPSVFTFHTRKDEILKTFANPLIGKIHGSLMSPVNTGRIELWTKQMTLKEVRRADQLAGKPAGILGYRKVMTYPNPILYFTALPMMAYMRLLFALMRMGARLPYRSNRRLAVHVTKLARIYGRIAGKKSRTVGRRP